VKQNQAPFHWECSSYWQIC